jgi:dihydrofolate reductase
MSLSAIVAMSKNRVIGKDNQLPWHLPKDLKRFKALTVGHTIVMGRKTYASIGKALPQRNNIILTRDRRFQAQDCTTVHHLNDIHTLAKKERVFVIGGAEVYHALLPDISELFITKVATDCQGDTFFPIIDETRWQIKEKQEHGPDKQHACAYTFLHMTLLTT